MGRLKGAREARDRLVDKGKGARQATILSHSPSKPAGQAKQKFETPALDQELGAEAASVLSAEARICVGTENGAGRQEVGEIRASVRPQTTRQLRKAGLGMG